MIYKYKSELKICYTTKSLSTNFKAENPPLTIKKKYLTLEMYEVNLPN